MAQTATFAEMARLAALGKMVEDLVKGAKRGPGRPPKAAAPSVDDPNAPPKKKRGRPKKVKPVEADQPADDVPATEWIDNPADSEV